MTRGSWRFDFFLGIRTHSSCIPEVIFGAIDIRHPMALWACDATSSPLVQLPVALELEDPSQYSEVPGNC